MSDIVYCNGYFYGFIFLIKECMLFYYKCFLYKIIVIKFFDFMIIRL